MIQPLLSEVRDYHVIKCAEIGNIPADASMI
jgi:hypothetical protein